MRTFIVTFIGALVFGVWMMAAHTEIRAGGVQGKIKVKPQCMEMARSYVAEFKGRQPSLGQYLQMKARIEECNDQWP